MPKKITRKKLGGPRPLGLPKHRRLKVVIAIGVVLSLFAVWTILASSGSLDSLFSQKGKRGHTLSTASLNSNSPSKEYIYAGGRLVATEEPDSSGCTPPASPGNSLVATAQSTTSVSLTWAVCVGADHYEVQRKQNITSGWVLLSPNPQTNSLPDNAVAANTSYLYQVRAVDALGCSSGFSNIDLATTVVFSDEPLTAGILIKAVHVTQLRTAIDAIGTTASLSQGPWTHPSLQGAAIKAVDMLELRSNLNSAITALNQALSASLPLVGTDSSLAVGQPIKAVHLQDVRNKVK